MIRDTYHTPATIDLVNMTTCHKHIYAAMQTRKRHTHTRHQTSKYQHDFNCVLRKYTYPVIMLYQISKQHNKDRVTLKKRPITDVFTQKLCT